MDLHTTVKGSAFVKETLEKVKGQGHIATEKTTSLKIILKNKYGVFCYSPLPLTQGQLSTHQLLLTTHQLSTSRLQKPRRFPSPVTSTQMASKLPWKEGKGVLSSHISCFLPLGFLTCHQANFPCTHKLTKLCLKCDNKSYVLKHLPVTN